MFLKHSVALYVKQETKKVEDSEEDEVEDEEEDEIEEEEDDDDDDEEEVVEEESKGDAATEKNEPKAHEGKPNEHVNIAEKVRLQVYGYRRTLLTLKLLYQIGTVLE